MTKPELPKRRSPLSLAAELQELAATLDPETRMAWQVTPDDEGRLCVTTADRGPWWIASSCWGIPGDDEGVAHTAYIAACSPQHILSLCAAIKAYDAALRAARELADHVRWCPECGEGFGCEQGDSLIAVSIEAEQRIYDPA